MKTKKISELSSTTTETLIGIDGSAAVKTNSGISKCVFGNNWTKIIDTTNPAIGGALLINIASGHTGTPWCVLIVFNGWRSNGIKLSHTVLTQGTMSINIKYQYSEQNLRFWVEGTGYAKTEYYNTAFLFANTGRLINVEENPPAGAYSIAL